MPDALTLAAIAFVVVTAFAAAFQVGLALGAPWGAYAMGGVVPGRFPPRLRAVAVVQAGLLIVLAAIVGSAAGLFVVPMLSDLPEAIWLAVAFSALSLVLNSISRSGGERRLWVPVALVMLVCSLIVASSIGGGLVAR